MPSSTLRSAFDLCAVATALDPHFASDWRVLFNDHFSASFPDPPAAGFDEKRGEAHVKRLLKNLCYFEHQVLAAAAAAPAPPAAAAAANAPAAAADDAEMDIVVEQPVNQFGSSLRTKLKSLKSRPSVAAGPAPPAAVPNAKQNAPVQPWMAEVDRFFDEFLIHQRFTSDSAPRDPLFMWLKIHGQFPLLARVAVRVFSCAATSADAERVFSRAGLIATPERASLKPSTLLQLVFLSLTLKGRYNDAQRRANRHAVAETL
jgi:hypothetical protein